jgi:transposase
MRRYALRDDQWDRIKDFLPGGEGHVGGTAADNRLFVEAVLYRYRAGLPWRDLPERFGDWKIIHQGFSRCAKSGIFERIFNLLASDHDNEYMMIDAPLCGLTSTVPGAKKNGAQAIGRSRGGLTTKINALVDALVDALGNPIRLILTPDTHARSGR